MTERRFELDEESWLSLQTPLSEREADEWMAALVDETKLEERTISLFGKTMLQPRLVGWGGDPPYTYSRQTLAPRTLSPAADRLLDVTNRILGFDFNHLLFNLYRDERDSMGLHADDEVELGLRPRVASWSFGQVRRFVIQPKKGISGPRLTLDLPHGGLLVMEGATQERYLHQVPKETSVRKPRLNVTCRRVLPPGLR